jgi:histidinol dehydrogenase
VLPAVKRIVADVRKQGDRALLRYAAQFDGLAGVAALRVTPEEMAAAWEAIDPAMREALTTAADQIRAFAVSQLPASFSDEPIPGLTTGQLVRPLGSVGCYVPSGRHPLPSTLLMTAIPAQVAGVKRIAVVSPKPAPETLAAAHLLGITEFYRLGGAHAVAALAYGTASVRASTRSSARAISTSPRPSGSSPSIAPSTCSPAPRRLSSPANAATRPTLPPIWSRRPSTIPRRWPSSSPRAPIWPKRSPRSKSCAARNNAVARQALDRNGLVIIASSVDEARAITNRLAPEHLTVDAASDLDWVQNAGSVFVGRWSAQPMGDYISGPNHTLPTGGMARVRGGLSVNDFVKLITVQEYSAQAMRALGPPLPAGRGRRAHRPRRSHSHAPQEKRRPRD